MSPAEPPESQHPQLTDQPPIDVESVVKRHVKEAVEQERKHMTLHDKVTALTAGGALIVAIFGTVYSYKSVKSHR